MDIRPEDTRVSQAVRDCRAHRADSEKSVPRFRLTRLNGRTEQRAGWTLLRYERNLCFFLKGPRRTEVPKDQMNGS